MKWRRKKLSESSSSRPSLISHVFPLSWLTKFKQKNRDVEAKPAKVMEEVKRSSRLVGPAKGVVGARGGRFYSGEGDDFWRLSFGEEGVQRKDSRGYLTSVWYDSDNKLDVPPSVCQSCGSNGMTLMGNEEIDKFNNMILNARKMRELPRDMDSSAEMNMFKSEQTVSKAKRVPTEKERKLKKLRRRGLEEKCLKIERYPDEVKEKSRKSVEKDDVEFAALGKIPKMEREIHNSISAELKKHHYVSSTDLRNSNLRIVEEDGEFAVHNLSGNHGISAEKMSSEWERLKEMKIKELKSKNENQRKSLYISRESQTRKTKQSSKVKVGSPRIKALEDMKKAKLKMKKGKEKTIEGRTNLESFAVVKCSFDPQKDFRDSMIEMILEKRFSQPEELEELLACYLTLNSDEYHDLIIKVFQQVWFDLNQACFHELQNENCCNS